MHSELERYAAMTSFLSEVLGESYAVGLFDLTDSEFPMIAGPDREPKIREKVRAFVVEAMEWNKTKSKGYVANRPLQVDVGKLMKVSVFFIRDGDGTPVGALWISMRCDLLLKLEVFAANLLQFDLDEVDEESPETSSASRETSLDTITQMVEEFGVAPGRTTRAEREEIICDLYDAGVFNLKGAVAKTAEELQISEQSVYRYVAKIKKAREW